MNFKAKRMSYKLEPYTVASRLGIDYYKYLEVEKGKLDLSTKQKEEFSKILTNAPQLKIETQEKILKISELQKSGELRKLIYDKGYSVTSLAKASKIPQSTISHILLSFDGSISMKEYMYDFLMNPLNVPQKEKPKEKSKNKSNSKEIVKMNSEELYNDLITNYSFKNIVDLYKLIKQNFENIN